MAKKSLTFLFCFILLINFASALTLTDPSTWDDQVRFHETSPNGKYGYYEIADTLLWIFNKKQIKTVELIENDYSVYSAWNIKQIEVFEPTKLFDKTEYFGLDKKTDKSNYIKGEIQLYRQWINSSETREVNLSCNYYESISNETGSIEVCVDWNTEERLEDTSHWTDWEEYNYGSVQKGLYQTKTIVTRDNQRTGVIDWIDTSEGHQLKEWATWWDTDWNYKREIIVTENSGTSVNNYSTLIYINYSANMNTDFSDLRFLDSSESTELSYWIENKTDSSFAWVWVKVPTITASSNTTIFIYYGNSIANSNSNPENAFLWYDNASTDKRSYYSETYDQGLSATLGYDSVNDWYTFVEDGSSGFDHFVVVPNLSSDNYLIEANVKVTTGTANGAGLVISADTNNGVFNHYGGNPSNFFNINKLVSGSLSLNIASGTATFDTNWHTHKISKNGSTYKVYFDNSLKITHTITGTLGNGAGFDTRNKNGIAYYDDIIVRGFLSVDPTITIGNETQNAGVQTELLAPLDNFLSTVGQVNFSVNSSSIQFTNMTNVTLYIWNANNASELITNFTSLNSNTSVISNWTNTLSEGTYYWNAETCGTGVDCTFANTNRTLLVHFTAPTINITAPNETFIYQPEGSNLTLIYNISESGENLTEHLQECWFEYNDTEVLNNISYDDSVYFEYGFASNYVNVTSITVNQQNITITTLSSIPETCSRRGNFSLYVEPSGLTTTAYCRDINNNLASIGSWDSSLSPSSTNITAMKKRLLNCTANNASFEYVQDKNALCVHAIDEFGLHNENITTWGYIFEKFNLTYDTPVYEGSLNTYSLELILGGGASLTQAIFEFNDTNYTTNVVFSGGEYLVTSAITAPVVSSDTNYSFGFYLLTEGQIYKPRTDTQEVLNLDFGVCGIGDDILLNVSLVDEGTRTSIVGDIELNAQLIGRITGEITEATNLSFEDVSYAEVCLTPTASKENFYLDLEMRYEADDYAAELYNIQMANLSLYPKNLTVFDLALNDTTEFLVKYQDDSLVTVEGAVVQLQRKYIGSDAFEVVEAPETSSIGTAIVHIDLNTNKYRATVVKDGEVLDVFDNLVFNCENELSGQCTENLFGKVDPENSITIEDLNDFSYSVSSVNNTITTSFSIPSGTPSPVNVILRQVDTFGNESLCNQTIISSAGSLDCTYNDTIGDSIVYLEISKDGSQQAKKSYIIPEAGAVDWLGNNYIIVVVFILSLVGMAMTSPEWMIVNAVATLVLAGGLWLLNGLNFVMGLGALIWVIVAAVILIMKLAKQEDR